MTLDQLRYIAVTADTGNITEAAKRLFISQPSLSNAIHALEKEMNVTIFLRTSRGVIPTPEGETLLGYARQVMAQIALMEEEYQGAGVTRRQFSVSTQHYSFSVKAFSQLLQEYPGPEYNFCIRETRTYEILEDVAAMKSEVGVLYLNDFNEQVMMRELRDHGLSFHLLFEASPHVFLSAAHPLAKKTVVSLEDLDPYPRLSYEQGDHNSFYFSEELASTRRCKKDIVVSDRATLFNLLIGLSGYTICSGILNTDLNGDDIVARPLDVQDSMRIGYVVKDGVQPGRYARRYIELLSLYTKGNGDGREDR